MSPQKNEGAEISTDPEPPTTNGNSGISLYVSSVISLGMLSVFCGKISRTNPNRKMDGKCFHFQVAKGPERGDSGKVS